MRKGFHLLTVVGLLAAGSMLLSVRAHAALQGPPPAQPGPAAPRTYVVLGCLARTGNNVYTLKDFRDGSLYQIDASAQVVAPSDSLAWHEGHELEIHGTFEGAAAGGALRMKATQIIYISRTCPTPPAQK